MNATTENPRAVIENNRPVVEVLTKIELLDDFSKHVTTKADLIARTEAVKEDVTTYTDADDEALTKLGRDIAVYLSEVEADRKRIGQPYTDITTAINDLFNKEWRDGIGHYKTIVSKVIGKRVDHRAAVEEARLQEIAKQRRIAEQAAIDKAAEAENAGKHLQAEVGLEQAQHQANQAEIAETRVEHSSFQDLGRRTGSAGTMTATRTLGFTIDRAALDLEVLRPFIALDALEMAVRKFNGVNSNGMAPNKRDISIAAPIKGVLFEAVTGGGVRK